MDTDRSVSRPRELFEKCQRDFSFWRTVHSKFLWRQRRQDEIPREIAAFLTNATKLVAFYISVLENTCVCGKTS